MHNAHMTAAKRKVLTVLRDSQTDPTARKWMADLYEKLKSAEITYKELIDEAKEIGVRGPSFDGDYVGWLPDDFDDDDE